MMASVTLMAVPMYNISRAEVVSPYNLVELSVSGGDVTRAEASCSSAGLSKSKDGHVELVKVKVKAEVKVKDFAQL